MSKKCVSCGKEIPDAAAHCVFCGTAQPRREPEEPELGAAPEQRTEATTSEPPAVVIEAPPADATEPEASPSGPIVVAPPAASRGHVTLIGLSVEQIQAAAAEPASAPEEGAPVAASKPVLDATPVRGLPVVPEPAPMPAAPTPMPVGPAPFSSAARLVMASGGLVLVALFSLPWRGVTSWQLLETLAGADFIRQLFFLAGGAVLVATAVLPVPAAFRAAVGMCVAAVPLVLGADGLLEGWRGVLGALVAIGLPAALLQLRPRQAAPGPARALLLASIAGLAIVYLAPSSNVMPIVYVVQLLRSGLVMQAAVGLFLFIPLLLGLLSLMGLFARDLLSAAVLLSVLVLLWPPAAVLYFRGDGTQLYVALALLWTAAIAALCAAQLLAMAARPQSR